MWNCATTMDGYFQETHRHNCPAPRVRSKLAPIRCGTMKRLGPKSISMDALCTKSYPDERCSFLKGHPLRRSTHTSIECDRMHYLRVHLPEKDERAAIPETHVELDDCVVEVFIEENGPTIRRNAKYLRSVMDDPSALPYGTGSRITDWWCDRNEGIRCPHGALIFYNTTIPWTPNYTWHLTHTIIKFVHRKRADVLLSEAFSMVRSLFGK